jgi:hypothetical protein
MDNLCILSTAPLPRGLEGSLTYRFSSTSCAIAIAKIPYVLQLT